MNEEDFEKWTSLMNQIKLSDGWKIEMGIRDIRRSQYIFMSNYNHLKKYLEAFDSKAGFGLWGIKNRDKMDLFQMEIIRLFHNFLASVKSFVDHTRTIVDKVHGDNEFSKEYNSKKKEVFADSELSRFVQDLRNYMLHIEIPIVGARMTPKESMESEMTSSIILDLSTLKSWGGWKQKSKEYLHDAKSDINLHEIIVDYASIVIDFYNWFLRRQEELFKEELDQTQELKDEYNKIILKYKFPDE
jgi:hypothetical protein